LGHHGHRGDFEVRALTLTNRDPVKLTFVEIAKQGAIQSTSMTTPLQSTLYSLAASFTESILDVIRGASLDELLQSKNKARLNGRSSGTASATPSGSAAKRRFQKSGRLPRRSAEDIAKTAGQVVSLVKKHKEGLRAEQIRSELGLQPKEMPRILKEGLAKKVLKSKGQKRATTYFAT
jgi:hypothetical protein